MPDGSLDVNQQAIASKQIAATVRMKRMGQTAEHLNSALQFLNLSESARSPESTKAANDFIKDYFEHASKNIVDLTSEIATESLELLARHEMKATGGVAPA